MTISAQKVRFLDLSVPQSERELILQAVDSVLTHGRFILGPEVAQIEESIAELCHRKYGVGVSSGTDALFLALKALGIGSGDEVITTSLSWIATANAIAMTGAKPIFADIQSDLNIDPVSVARLITKRTRAIVPVHYTGRICDMDSLLSIASQNQLALIEDAAQAFGARLGNRPAGSFGNLACFSMNPMKVFAACGEAGMILTDDEALRDRLHALRYNGTINKEHCIETSLNGRMDTIQAAILLQRLPLVDQIIERRREIAKVYDHALSKDVIVPSFRKDAKDVYYTYTIQTPQRDALKKYLEERGVEVKIQHPILMCDQAPYRAHKSMPLPNAEKAVGQILCLPAHEKLTNEEQEYVIHTIQEFFCE